MCWLLTVSSKTNFKQIFSQKSVIGLVCLFVCLVGWLADFLLLFLLLLFVCLSVVVFSFYLRFFLLKKKTTFYLNKNWPFRFLFCYFTITVSLFPSRRVLFRTVPLKRNQLFNSFT